MRGWMIETRLYDAGYSLERQAGAVLLFHT
jgi:hypothetical protein